jgi:hypothetical protein
MDYSKHITEISLPDAEFSDGYNTTLYIQQTDDGDWIACVETTVDGLTGYGIELDGDTMEEAAREAIDAELDAIEGKIDALRDDENYALVEYGDEVDNSDMIANWEAYAEMLDRWADVQIALLDTMTTSEAEAEFGMAEGTVRKAAQRDDIPARKSGGTWLIRRADAEARWGGKARSLALLLVSVGLTAALWVTAFAA